jgi:hypothetical protein
MKRLAPILFSCVLAAGSVTAPGQETNSATGKDFSAFEIIVRKNIFDQSRTGLSTPGARRKEPQIDRITLLGIGGDAGHPDAIFGGNGTPDGFVKVGDHVREFELNRITPDCVRLSNSTNTFVLDMTDRRSLRRVDNGPWEGSADQSEPVNIATNTADDTAASTPSAADAARPGESPIERKLRLRREQEEK